MEEKRIHKLLEGEILPVGYFKPVNPYVDADGADHTGDSADIARLLN